MNDTSSTKSTRPTLKLKVGARRPADLGKTTSIPQPDSKVALYVVPTNEELMIARHTISILATRAGQPHPAAMRSAFG